MCFKNKLHFKIRYFGSKPSAPETIFAFFHVNQDASIGGLHIGGAHVESWYC